LLTVVGGITVTFPYVPFCSDRQPSLRPFAHTYSTHHTRKGDREGTKTPPLSPVTTITSTMTTGKKVTFSAVIKTVSNQGEIRYEPDALSPSNQPVEDYRFESFDFLQHHFEELFPFGGDEYEDHVNMLSMPFFRCNNPEVKKIGAVDFLKALAKNPPNVAAADSTSGPIVPAVPGSLAVELAKKKTDQKDAKKRGVILPKEIPGRDTPEQRKLRLVGAGKIQGSAAKTSTPGISSDKLKQPKSIMKVTTNEYDDVIVTNLKSKPPTKVSSAAKTTHHAGPSKEADNESCKQASRDCDEREQPDSSQPPMGSSIKEMPDSPGIPRTQDRYSPIYRKDPPIANDPMERQAPRFQDSTSGVKEIGAVDSLKGLAGKTPNVATVAHMNGPSTQAAPVSPNAELPIKNLDDNTTTRAVIHTNEVPGRDTSLQGKLRLIDSGKTRSSAAKTCTQGISSDDLNQPKLVMKVTTYNAALITSKSKPTTRVSSAATPTDHTGPSLEAHKESSKRSSRESEEREQPDTSEPPMVPPGKEMNNAIGTQRLNNRYCPTSRDPPSAQELLGGQPLRSATCAQGDDFRPRVSPSDQRKPDPSALFSSEDMYRPGSMPCMAYTSRPTVLTRRPSRTAPSE
jgi:hypothetical protein